MQRTEYTPQAAQMVHTEPRSPYHRQLAMMVAADPALRALPRLRSINLRCLRDDGHPVDLFSLLIGGRVLLRGEPGSGRRLLLLQALVRWLDQPLRGTPAPLPVDLRLLDDGEASPYALLAALVASLDPSHPAVNMFQVRWRLLLSGLEDLPPHRRTIWRGALLNGLLPRSIELGLILVPADEPAWLGFTAIRAPRPSAQLIADWATHLAPQVETEQLYQALNACQAQSLLDTAMVAWLCQRGTPPTERALLTAILPQLGALLSAPAMPIGTGLFWFYQQISMTAEQPTSPSTLPLVPLLDDACMLPAARADDEQRARALIRHEAWVVPTNFEAIQASLATAADDAERTEALINALGYLRDQRAVALLAPLLGKGALERLRQACPAPLLRSATNQVLADPECPPALQRNLRAAAARCVTPADLPTTPHEFLVIMADRHRAAAARALAQIGGHDAIEALVIALTTDETGRAVPILADALAQLCQHEPTDLAQALYASTTPMHVRWLLAERMAALPSALDLSMAALQHPRLDGMTRGALAEQIGAHLSDLSALLALVHDPSEDRHVRISAVRGIGHSQIPGAQSLLFGIACDPTQADLLRREAVAQLRQPLSAETRIILRSMLRSEVDAPDLLVGILQILGALRDHSALTLISMRSHDSRPQVARAAREALANLGELPDPPELASEAPPAQLQALDLLIRSGVSRERLAALLSERHRPLAFRMRALDAAGAAAPLTDLLYDPQEPSELRARAIQLLCLQPHGLVAAHAQASLALVALREHDPIGVRMLAVDLLSGQHAIPTLLRLCDDPMQHASLREQAIQRLAVLIGHEP
ncbi:MAG: hypothetical protein Fur005_30870 [Roseiflexaceae bacterium]